MPLHRASQDRIWILHDMGIKTFIRTIIETVIRTCTDKCICMALHST